MIDYLGLTEIRKLIGELGVGEIIAGLADEIEKDYRRWPEFETSARLASHSPVGVIELMPTSDGRQFSFKYVNGHPKNTAAGLLTVTAFGVLADVTTGYPVLLSEMTLTTALRTAAMSALAARWVARPESRVMALIGNGAQSEFQAIAFHRLLGLRELRLYDVDAAATAKLERNLRATGLDFGIVRAASGEEAAHGADILTTVTADKRNAVIVTPAMVTPGMHLNAIGGDCPGKTELHRDVLTRRDTRIVVEYEPQSRIEGEIQQLPSDFPVTEFARIARGEAPGRGSATEVTIFDSVGFALEDFSALRYLHRQLRARSEAPPRIDLIPTLQDPKNLFALLDRDAGERLRRVS
jgi:ornithine cyclodeaminase